MMPRKCFANQDRNVYFIPQDESVIKDVVHSAQWIMSQHCTKYEIERFLSVVGATY